MKKMKIKDIKLILEETSKRGRLEKDPDIIFNITKRWWPIKDDRDPEHVYFYANDDSDALTYAKRYCKNRNQIARDWEPEDRSENLYSCLPRSKYKTFTYEKLENIRVGEVEAEEKEEEKAEAAREEVEKAKTDNQKKYDELEAKDESNLPLLDIFKKYTLEQIIDDKSKEEAYSYAYQKLTEILEIDVLHGEADEKAYKRALKTYRVDPKTAAISDFKKNKQKYEKVRAAAEQDAAEHALAVKVGKEEVARVKCRKFVRYLIKKPCIDADDISGAKTPWAEFNCEKHAEIGPLLFHLPGTVADDLIRDASRPIKKFEVVVAAAEVLCRTSKEKTTPTSVPTAKKGDPVSGKAAAKRKRWRATCKPDYLIRGCKTAAVTKLQKDLRDRGFGEDLGEFGKNKDGVDGKFGRYTEAAVKAFQRAAEQLKIDGIAGPNTMKVLRAVPAGVGKKCKTNADCPSSPAGIMCQGQRDQRRCGSISSYATRVSLQESKIPKHHYIDPIRKRFMKINESVNKKLVK